MLARTHHEHQQAACRGKIITIWAGLEASALKKQLRHLDKKVGIAFYNGQRPFRHNRTWLHFVPFSGGRKVRHGLGIRIKRFPSGGSLLASEFAEAGGVARAKLIPLLHSLGVTKPAEHVKLFFTVA